MNLRDSSDVHCGPGWVVLDVKAAGICGSEITAFLGKNELRHPPLIMGHEFAGTVVEKGVGVSEDWMGKQVVVNPLVTCGHCRFCRTGNRQLCSERKIIGIDFPGGFAERVAVPMSSCLPVADSLRAALIEPFSCGVRAVERSGAGLGDDVIVFGVGMIGLSIVRLLRQRGVSRCVAVDAIASRLRWAKMWGATETIDASQEDAEKVGRQLSSEGFDCAIDAAGHRSTRDRSLTLLRRGGRAVFVGLHEDQVGIRGNQVVRSETEIVGSFAYSDDDFRRSVKVVEEGFIDTSGGWMDVRPLEAGQASFVEQATGSASYSKILLEP